MQATLFQDRWAVPAESCRGDREYLQSCWHYKQVRHAKVLKLRRQLVRRRALLRRRLQKALSPSLLAELEIRVVLDTRHLQQPGFVGVFEFCGQDWTIAFQPHLLGGRWFLRSSASSRLYSCSSQHLETQLCYALGQCCVESSAFACA